MRYGSWYEDVSFTRKPAVGRPERSHARQPPEVGDAAE
jgi:hypothetical protein